MIDNKFSKGLAFAVILLFISVSFQPMIAEKTQSIEKESDYNNTNFEQAKEYLFQTLIAISNNPEVKELLKQNNQKMFTSDYDYKSAFLQIFFKKPKLLKSILFTRPEMTYEYLETNYNKGIKIVDFLGVEETSKMMESVKITNPELFNELKIIIKNNEELSNRIPVLEEMNNDLKSNMGFQNSSVICNILNISFFLIGLRMSFSVALGQWAIYRDNPSLYNISVFLFNLFLIIAEFIFVLMIIFDCIDWHYP
jgi:hypothetical protein